VQRRLTVVAAAYALALPLAAAAPAAARTPVWLCKPGLTRNPCTPGLSTTVYSPTLRKLRVIHPRAVKHPAIDCFYVYPTVSDQKTGNANLHIDPEERSIARYQAARYSQYCRVFAPMYRQLTLLGIGLGKPTTTPNPALGLADVRAAFAYYLRHLNHGRGFVLIGHSQGSFVLRTLIAKDIDSKPAVRRRLLSAILLGGNVLVKPGPRGIGGDFKHIPACRKATQLGCVIAFSTFDQPAPATSLFGRPPNGSKDIVLCTNPAALAGGSGRLDFITPRVPFDPKSTLSAGIALLGLTTPSPPPTTAWYELPNAYRGKCVNSNGAHVLMATALGGAQTAKPSPTPDWGLHLLDGQIALGNLIAIVKSETAAYLRRGG
jgi:Protein of unknown function (DUF3089)